MLGVKRNWPEMYAKSGIEASRFEDGVDHTQILEDLQRAGLKSFAARAWTRGGSRFNEAKRDAAPRQIYRKREAGRTRADDDEPFLKY
jgi:hypothetical protein